MISKPNRTMRRNRIQSGPPAAQNAGVVATEFALCVPLLLLMALACADFGRVSYYQQVVCNAARTGAETGATHKFTPYTRSAWEAGVYQAVLAEMQNMPNFNAGELNYNLTTTVDSDDMARIKISVSYPFRTAVAWPALPNEVQLHKNVEFRQFR
jgi:Flp pilus assembly protein TadG